jgi:hypothetical protein
MRRAILLIPLLTAGAGGCYDGQAMVERISQRVSDDQREEIDLGVYQVTLPRKSDDPVATTVRLELVATIHRQYADKFQEQFDKVQAHLRHATILSLRSCQREELVEADLATLHERIETTTAKFLTAAPIEAIAFRSFAVYED